MLLDVGGLTRQAVHKVYADVFNPGFQADVDGFDSLSCSVSATEEPEKVIVKGLHTHADTVYSVVTQSGNISGRYVIRIAFDCQLNDIAEAEYGTNAVYDLPYLIRRETRWCSASEIYRTDCCTPKIFTAMFQFPADGIDITCGF